MTFPRLGATRRRYVCSPGLSTYTYDMIYIGTSGFSYDDWKGHFYPEKMDKKEMLAYYSRQFSCVEINSTYYALPSPFTFVSMMRKSGPDFRFVVKAHKDMTHTEEPTPEIFEGFKTAVHPLIEQRRLGCALAQFPWSFKNTPDNQDKLRRFKERMGDIPTVIEFRNSDWVNDETFALLRELNLGFCSVDEPGLKGLMPRITVATSEIGYVRFHGRNAHDWWKHEAAWQRYNYLYAPEELEEWVPRVRQLERETESTYLFFNTHYQGKSAQNAKMFASMLDISLPNIEPTPDNVALDL